MNTLIGLKKKRDLTVSNDMFLMQMLGRFRSHKLTIHTIIDPTVIEYAKLDVEKIAKRELASSLAVSILDSPKHISYTCGERDPAYLGMIVRMSTYCMSEDEFKKVVTDAYNAGLESAWAIEN